jgi:hypothetical protein
MTPGLRTSEFKAALATVILSLVAAGVNYVSDKTGFIGAVAGGLGYVISRGLAKNEQRPSGTQ